MKVKRKPRSKRVASNAELETNMTNVKNAKKSAPSVVRGRVVFVAPEYREPKKRLQQIRRFLSLGEPLAFQYPKRKREKKK